MMQLLQQQTLKSLGNLDVPYRGDHDRSVGGRMRAQADLDLEFAAVLTKGA
jgi:hypothetical protein